MQELGEAQLGREIEVLVEGYDEATGFWYGRSEADSPDIDGCVFFTVNGKEPERGSFVMVQVEECVDCDLIGALVE